MFQQKSRQGLVWIFMAGFCLGILSSIRFELLGAPLASGSEGQSTVTRPDEGKKGPAPTGSAPPPVTLQDFYQRGSALPPKADPDVKRVLPQATERGKGGANPAAPLSSAGPMPVQADSPTGGLSQANPTPQAPPPPGPDTARPRPPARGSAPIRRVGGATSGSGGENEIVQLRLDNMPLPEFINFMATTLGLEYILHQNASAMGGSITINAKVSKADLFAVFETVLRQNNTGIVRDARVSNLYYIEPIGDIKRESNIRVIRSYPPNENGGSRLTEMPAKPEERPSTGPSDGGSAASKKEEKDLLDKRTEFATYVLPIEFMGSGDVSEMIQYLQMLSPAGSAVNYGRGNLLIVTDFKNNVDRLVEVIRALDGRMFEDGNIDLIKMRYSSVIDTTEDLKKIFTRGQGDTPIGINFVPLERLNALLVVCNSTRALEEVHRWVDRLDSPQGRGAKTHIYHVQNSIAGNIASILAQVYAEGPGGSGNQRPPGAPGAPGAYGTSGAYSGQGVGYTGQGTTGTGGYRGGTSGYSGSYGSSSYGGYGGSGGYGGYGGYGGSSGYGGYGGSGGYGGYGGSGGLGGYGGIGGGGIMGARTRGTIAPGGIRTELGGRDGSIRIIVDDLNNSLIIQSSDADYEYLLETIKQLDVLPRQVLIDAKVLKVDVTDSFSFGIISELARRGSTTPASGDGGASFVANPRVSSFFGGPAWTQGSTGTLSNADNPLSKVAINPTLKSFAFVGNESIILGQLQALRDRRQSKVLQSPTILALDGQQSRLHVGTRNPVNTGSVTPVSGAGAASINTTQYVEVGTTLEVVPRINASGIVTLEIALDISSQPAASETLTPIFTATTLNTTLTVRDGETVVIGGIITEDKSIQKTRVPLLGDIPLVGALFGTTGRSAGRSELIILMTPRVVRDVESHVAATEDVRMRYKEVDKALYEVEDQLRKTIKEAQQRKKKYEQKRAKREFDPQEPSQPPTRDRQDPQR